VIKKKDPTERTENTVLEEERDDNELEDDYETRPKKKEKNKKY
jgi:hypothetical protein